MSKKIGIKENLYQFILLVVTNLFVGSMVGIERTVLPLLGEEQFGLASTSAALSFIISFGFSKAIVNYFAGQIADKFGRKRVLLLGWVVGLFVPILTIFAHAWWVIVFANILLGINQGLTWSMTVNMKIDISKANQRGTAVGLNEFAGYSGVAIMAAVSGYVASSYSLRPEPFYLGIGIVIIGILLSLIVKDTGQHLKIQIRDNATKNESINNLSSKEVFNLTTWKDKNLSSISFSGLATNLKDGMAWGLFPLYFTTVGLSVSQTGTIVAVYPAAWGFFQLFTGVLSDKVGRKKLITYGMWTQAFALWFILFVNSFSLWILGAILLGLGTAMVYPTLQAAIGDVASPNWRASSMGVYRFWRDSGYAFGALIAGIIADLLGVTWAIEIVALLPFLAGVYSRMRLDETLKTVAK
ncbi:UNVERIFIED_ORG: sugar phosphate permease [Anoxybacillus amylolyticus]|uniref:MFS transporter n=1 Tax=Geobacillus thermopakistaniensis (strain MAS1) TaxID=1408282 RepID=A0A7U9P7G6_GEOTM|nr:MULTISPECIES: MFS transporter [unclassified Geobacillus]ESU73410.1 MFS transporter [Geobacillus sp. MAS1]MED4877124.1 MFS transporter [Anoxybacillus geothermalis]TRY42481.1 MFS transporter [Geobacillus sp. LEMMJ02]